MRFSQPLCPECGAPAKGRLDRIPGLALLSIDPETGAYDFDGETDVWWDDQESEPVEGSDNPQMVSLQCEGEDRHVWDTETLED